MLALGLMLVEHHPRKVETISDGSRRSLGVLAMGDSGLPLRGRNFGVLLRKSLCKVSHTNWESSTVGNNGNRAAFQVCRSTVKPTVETSRETPVVRSLKIHSDLYFHFYPGGLGSVQTGIQKLLRSSSH